MSYRAIKDYVRRQIGTGVWPPGTKIPSENEFTQEFKVARMTVHRALSELTRDGLLGRSQGRGTFVAELSPVSSFLRVRDIHEEIVERGHRHHMMRQALRAQPCPREVAVQLGLAAGERVFHVVVVHHENDVP